jgi:hypothetical protein
MSKIGQRKKKANWESECVMCANCFHFRDSHIYLKNSLPVETVRHCDKWGFTTKLTSICDYWVDMVTKEPCVNPVS